MKKLFFILLSAVFAQVAFSQTWQKVYSYNEYLGLRMDSVFMPPQDTLRSAANGSFAFKNNHLYYKNTFGTWIQADGTGSGLSQIFAKSPILISGTDTAYADTSITGLATRSFLALNYYPLSGNPSGFLTSNGLPNVVNSLQVINELGSPSIRQDVIANRPAAGIVGRIFIATDTKVTYRDNGSSWDLIGASGSGGATSISGDATGSISGSNIPATVVGIRGAAVPALSNGFLKNTGGVWGYDNSIYITGNQPINWTSSGDVSGTSTSPTALSPALTVNGIQGHLLPTLAAGVPRYTGSSWIYDNSTWLTSAVVPISLTGLRALTSVAPNTDYWITDAGKGGTFYYVSSDVTSSDNTGTIVVDASGHRYYRAYSGPVNVQWFGAVDDNSTDCQAAINAAIAVAVGSTSSPSNKDLYFPVVNSGIYKITTFPGTTNNVIFDMPTGQTATPILMRIFGDKGATITTSLDSNTASQVGSRLFRFNSAYTDLIIENIFFQNTHALASSANYTGAIGLGGTSGNLIKHPIIRNCRFEGFSTTITLNGVSDAEIYANVFRAPLGHDNATNSTQPASFITSYCNSNGLTVNPDIHDNFADGYSGTDITTTTTRAMMDNFIYGTHIGGKVHDNHTTHFGTEHISINQYTSYVTSTDPTSITGNWINESISPGAWSIGTSTLQTVVTGIRTQAQNPLVTGNILYNVSKGISIYQQGVYNYPFAGGGIFANDLFMANSGQAVPNVGILISGYGSGTTNHVPEIAYNRINFINDSLKANAHAIEIDYTDSAFVHHNTVTVYGLVPQSYSLGYLFQTGSASTFLRGNTIIGPTYFNTYYTESSSSHVNLDSATFTSTVMGMAPASGGGTTNFLRADGTWATPGGSGFANPMTAAGQLIYGGTGGTATATATPAHAGMRPVWNGSVVAWTDTTAGGGSGIVSRTNTTVTGNTTVVIASGYKVTAITVVPGTALASFQVGTTSSGTDVIPTQALGTSAVTYNYANYFPSGATLYFQGITASTQIIVEVTNYN